MTFFFVFQNRRCFANYGTPTRQNIRFVVETIFGASNCKVKIISINILHYKTSFFQHEESNIEVVKLDFKNTLVIKESLKLASQILLPKYNFELWLNADVLRGPNAGVDTIPIDPDVFLDTCLEYFPSAVLSLGYTTTNVVYNANKQMKYSQEQMEEMYRLLDKKKCLGKALTFPVRAIFACKQNTFSFSLIINYLF